MMVELLLKEVINGIKDRDLVKDGIKDKDQVKVKLRWLQLLKVDNKDNH